MSEINFFKKPRENVTWLRVQKFGTSVTGEFVSHIIVTTTASNFLFGMVTSGQEV